MAAPVDPRQGVAPPPLDPRQQQVAPPPVPSQPMDPRQRATASARPILFGGEDAMEEDEAMPAALLPAAPSITSQELLSRIVQPSPYPHHTVTGPASSRFRNALSRVTTHPTSDVEAWQALITEASTCYRNILPSLHSVDADTHTKLDWIESCYGTLLKYFPYASPHYVTVVEMMLAQSARVGEEEGPLVDYGMDTSQRAIRCEAIAENIFRKVLGIEMDGTPVQDTRVGGMCTSSVELWLLYVRKRIRDGTRHAAATLSDDEKRAELIREWTTNAYELAISNASFVLNNHLIWKQYLAYVKSWTAIGSTTDHALSQKQMVQLRSVYQRLVTHPMTGLDQLWQEYESFERGQSEALAEALIAEFSPKYQHARSVYLERARIYNVAELQMGRLATPPVDIVEEDYSSKIVEENRFVSLWINRISYERTNPERLTPTDLVQRIRQAYKEMACVLTGHPEVWHMWSTWELLRAGAKESDRVEDSSAVLVLAQIHIPDSTLLAHAQAQIIELHTDTPAKCMKVMESFVERNPNTLGFVLHQQMVRRHKGMDAARAVFAKARRVLLEKSEISDTKADSDGNKEAKDSSGAIPEGGNSENAGASAEVVDDAEANGKRKMVTNRLDPAVGTVSSNPGVGTGQATPDPTTRNDSAIDGSDQPALKMTPGPITWHLYASHAAMEHRLNKSPTIAARVYELGLRKHVSFLTKPAYVLRYAQLLLELHDIDNLRALLTRAVAACEGQEGKSDEVAALWDMTLRFESMISGGSSESVSALHNIERRRRAALMGAEVEDVSTGGLVGASDPVVGIGSHKSTIAEQLVRLEGYDVSSNIVNGMSRSVDVLEIMGLWGNNDGSSSRSRMSTSNKTEWEDDMAGGKSDSGYQRRLHFQQLTASGLSGESAMLGDGGAPGAGGPKFLSAKDRLQQVGGGAPSAQNSAAQLILQQSPEWLHPLLLLLPKPLYRSAFMNKPPPHMIEMALTGLRGSVLPAERPSDDARINGSRKRKIDGGDSSDEEDSGMKAGGGYGSQFRARQRARQMGAQQNGSLGEGVVGP